MIIAHISDPHITAAADEAADRLRKAVEHIARLPARPDVVLITGDCVNNGAPREYERFRELISPLTMPVYVVPGNHDDRDNLARAVGEQGESPLDGFVQYVVGAWPVRLIALDTHVPGQGGGLLCERRLAWLDERLGEQPERPTVIFMHHPPFLVGLAPIDQIGLGGASAFGAIIARHPQVEAILAGHIHMMAARRYRGTVAVTCAAAGHHLLPDLRHRERLEAVMEPPALLLHVWQESTGLLTLSSLIGDYGPPRQLHDGERWLS
jgi:3',5'-cyclic AMP phosphodiesterase CpdA